MKDRNPAFLTTQCCAIALICCTVISLAGCAAATDGIKHRDSLQGLFSLSEEADKAYSESRWLEAARDYQLLSELVPEDPYAWFRLGNVYARQGMFEEATKAYQSSLKRDPVPPKPWYNLATTYVLSAQHALRQSFARLRPEDPVRQRIEEQLVALDAVIYQRQDSADSTGKNIPD